ncbi:4a-hydroxytetrahydrobiopterin dehydratase [Metabacillus crassostreae]|uniref:4a-hydroxytetrahydrobiopterin dehydratase n=1 Tax=Metabacillus crassostreae TaxID=929098 RepID=UPI0019575A3C|nr:4a-hydroxytetrahydrobiopterin dehydratase [Metabacillus crassostreae]MBM7602314.1 4a-hydroxytetrahydrobiopterin dehydratase [Metabacillus crassostreae]
MQKLSDIQIDEFLRLIEGWKLSNDKWLEKKYRFKDYLKGIEFVQKVANLSEELNHHPFISIDYKLVTIRLFSWRAKGITELDFELVKKYDEVYKELMS